MKLRKQDGRYYQKGSGPTYSFSYSRRNVNHFFIFSKPWEVKLRADLCWCVIPHNNFCISDVDRILYELCTAGYSLLNFLWGTDMKAVRNSEVEETSNL
jgi:hypothetical protein